MSGKGSSPRPYSVDQKTFSDNWNNIFSKKSESEKDWYLVAINPWHRWYYNPVTKKDKYTKLK